MSASGWMEWGKEAKQQPSDKLRELITSAVIFHRDSTIQGIETGHSPACLRNFSSSRVSKPTEGGGDHGAYHGAFSVSGGLPVAARFLPMVDFMVLALFLLLLHWFCE